MGRVVLDTSVVAKSVLAPPRYLERDIYKREIETRQKIRVILSLLEKMNYKVFFPKAGIIEVASVLKRSGMPREHVLKVVESLNNTFIVIDEDVVYDKALEVALTTAPSGFDTYFLALALLTDSLLVTDDKGMANQARRLRLNVIFVRETSTEEIRAKLLGQ
ncbi:nucleotide-binding protein [Ignicoccus pacificus DSM 13166]|uniref:Nucleotide-binding protein n=1 Tax=Ignicoccus pacificus DSM 13166 TaxID=940294 RepID=A0A977KB02_9CREN|nr:nucleotide-binding protein [Ignicoccus pacificus DSM 13166]